MERICELQIEGTLRADEMTDFILEALKLSEQ